MHETVLLQGEGRPATLCMLCLVVCGGLAPGCMCTPGGGWLYAMTLSSLAELAGACEASLVKPCSAAPLMDAAETCVSAHGKS